MSEIYEAVPAAFEHEPPVSTPDTADLTRRLAEPSTTSNSLPSLLLQAKLAVGPASDPFEDEADRVADEVVATLRIQRRVGGIPPAGNSLPPQRIAKSHLGTHTPTPPPSTPAGSSRVARSLAAVSIPPRDIAPVSRIQRAASVGADGGAVDAETEQAIRSSRGRVMPAATRSTMEGAFGADFSKIRVHTGSGAAELNNRIQAKAFTTGNDIFFRDGLPDTSSTGGQHLLAHELTHTVQQTGQTQRSSTIMRKWWSLGRKKPAGPLEVSAPMSAPPSRPEISGPTDAVQASSGGAVDLAKMGYKDVAVAGEQAPAAPAGYSGNAAQPVDPMTEAAKPAGVVTAAGIAGASTAGAMGDVAAGSGVGGGVIGFATAANAAMGLATANSMDNEAQQHGDAAMSKQARLRAKDEGATLAGGLANTGGGVASTVDVAQGTAAAVAKGAAPAAAGVAAGALGIVGGGAMMIQGTWRGGKAVVKLFRLTHGRGQQMLSSDGERWKKVIVAAEQFKVAINSLKVIAGALGVAAGALMIVGSPVGWAVGLAAAIVGGAYAGSKLIARLRNARDKMNAHAAAAGLPEIGDPTDVVQASSGGAVDLSKMGYDMSNVRDAGAHNARDTGSGFAQDAGEREDDTEARAAAIEKADLIATTASKNARVAAEMRNALSHGDWEFVFTMVETLHGKPDDDVSSVITDPADMRLHDAFSLLSAINIDPDLALADSGQALIEQKLSKAEAM